MRIVSAKWKHFLRKFPCGGQKSCSQSGSGYYGFIYLVNGHEKLALLQVVTLSTILASRLINIIILMFRTHLLRHCFALEGCDRLSRVWNARPKPV